MNTPTLLSPPPRTSQPQQRVPAAPRQASTQQVARLGHRQGTLPLVLLGAGVVALALSLTRAAGPERSLLASLSVILLATGFSSAGAAHSPSSR